MRGSTTMWDYEALTSSSIFTNKRLQQKLLSTLSVSLTFPRQQWQNNDCPKLYLYLYNFRAIYKFKLNGPLETYLHIWFCFWFTPDSCSPVPGVIDRMPHGMVGVEPMTFWSYWATLPISYGHLYIIIWYKIKTYCIIDWPLELSRTF